MSVMPSEFPAKCTPSKLKMFCLPTLALTFCASAAWAAAPAVVIDSQETLGIGYNSPQSIAVNNTNFGSYFIADTKNNQVVATFQGTNFPVLTPGFTLSGPQAVALDAKGDLFIADTPTNNGTSFGRIIEVPADATGHITSTAHLVFSGAPLTNPISLAIDSTGTLFIGDYDIVSDTSTIGSIYSLAPGAPAPTLLNFTGINSSTFIPAALVRDSSTNLYFADNGSFNGGVYIATDTGGTAQPVATESFVINQPSGLALDTAGDLLILSLLGTGSGNNPGQQVVVIPAASPTTPYILPNTGIGTSSSMAFDAQGNLDVLDSADGQLFQLTNGNPINMGSVNVGKTGLRIIFNFEFNAPATLRGFRAVSQGDVSTELTQMSGGSCTNGRHDTVTGPGNPTVSPFFPYTCFGNYEGTPAYPGLRSTAIEVEGPTAATILGSAPVYETGVAAAEVTYPLNAKITATNLQQPQAIAISGLNKKVYIADTQAGVVYSTNGLGGSGLTKVSTGATTLSAPSALALDGAGNLYIADFNNGDVIEVPTTTGLAPSVVNTGGLLQHPIALALDLLGNLYIGDAGPGGVDAGNSDPGFLVKVPFGGAAFKMTIPSVSIVFPQALAIDPITGKLVIGDGGDPSGSGQVVVLSADGTSATQLGFLNVTNPTGLALDPAEDLYVLDGVANTITVAPASPAIPPYVLPFSNTALSAASALAISAGGQSFLVANIGGGSSNNLVYINGNASTLSFGKVQEGSQSQTQTANTQNIGNAALTLADPYFVKNTPNASFNILGSSTCANNLVLTAAESCSLNIQFQPTGIGATTQQIKIDSNAYNSGVPTLTLQGTGTAAGSARRQDRK
jgi:sugar lactone lactonase YvrE